MTTIRAIPDEVLRLIFGALDSSDLYQCQKVCFSWYSIAHIELLKEVHFKNPQQMEQFIRSIESDPNPLYLKAVQTILFDFQHSSTPNYELHIDTIDKLFFQLINLNKVEILGSLALLYSFDDDVCKNLLKSCPKLNKFEVYSNEDNEEYFTVLFNKIRLISTMIEVEEREYSTVSGLSFLQYISAFPRLQEIQGVTFELVRFEQWLAVLQQVPHLRTISLVWEGDETIEEARHQDPGELFLARKPKNERDLLVERLSRITVLKFDCGSAFSVQSIKFASKYLTGITKFELSTSFSGLNLTDPQNKMISNNILDLFCSAKDYGSLHLRNMKLTDLSRHLPTILKKIYQTSAATTNFFRLERNPRGETHLRCCSSRSKRSIAVSVREDIDLQVIIRSLFTSDFRKVDSLILTIPHNCAYAHMYFDILLYMPLLKTVTLDIPTHNNLSAVKLYEFEYRRPLVHVEELTLLPTLTTSFQKLIEMCHLTFPNLRRLNIHHSSGIFEEDLGEFQLRLPKYSLEILRCDVTTVKEKSSEKWDDEETTKEKDFFVVQIEVLEPADDIYTKSAWTFQLSKKLPISMCKAMFVAETTFA